MSGEQFEEYRRDQNYQAGEFFHLSGPTDALDSEDVTSAPMVLSWNRIGPWLPWMKMGDRSGYLLYAAEGYKLSSFSELDADLRESINSRVPRYQHAPRCYLDTDNMTSWSYFREQFDAYESGATFPLPVESPEHEASCLYSPGPEE